MDVKNDLGGGKPTLLIAEDEESNYLLLKTILHKYCNLIESLKEIRKLSRDIPVVMQSAYVFDSDMEAAREAGASGFITKPINLKILKNTISQYCPSVVW